MKKMLCVILTVVFTLSSLSGFATSYNDKDIALLLGELGIMKGDPDGNLRLDDFVTRAEFSKIAIAGSAYRNSVATNSAVSPFKDVPYSHWAAPYVKLAVTNNIITGYPDSTFKPENYVTYEEAVTICLKLLGYTSDDFGVSWPYGQTGMASNLKLNTNVSKGIGEYMTRRDVMNLVYNLLNTTKKGTTSDYISVFDYTIVEDCILIATTAEDSSVGSNKISTSQGIYNISADFDLDNVGKKGDVVLKDNKDLVIFIPSEQKINQYSIYQVLGNDIVVYENGSPINANFDTTMTVYNKSSKATLSSMLSSITAGDILTTYKNSAGVLDYGILKTDNLQGPYIAYSNEWYKKYGLDIAGYSVMRDGVKSKADDITMYDVIYYSKALNTVWAYSKKVTGIYETATPNKDLPTSVTVSGITYKIEGVNAYNELSSSGSFNYGDTVTLLLGRNGDVAGVMSPSASKETITGYIQGTGVKTFTSAEGNAISSFYVSLIRADGTSTDFRTNYDYSGFMNSIVSLSFNSDGIASVAAKSLSNNLYGKVDAANLKLGSHKLASNVNILDVSTTDANETGAYAKVFLNRIDGLNIDYKSIAYYTKNSDGEISELYLKNVTGDMYNYGVVLTAATAENGGLKEFTAMSNWGTYMYSYPIVTGRNFSIGAGVGIITNGNKINSFISLTQLGGQVKSILGNVLTTQSGDYEISGNASVFIKSGDFTYMQTNIEEISNLSKYNVKAYYDKTAENGGRIRVLVASVK